MASVIKDIWTSDKIQKQFYDESPVISMLQEAAGTTVDKMGYQAQVPILSGRAAGYTSTAAAGGSLNPAGNQPTAQATYTLVYHWFQVAMETAVLNQTEGSERAIIAGKILEFKGAIENMTKQCARQIVSNGDGIIAECATGGASTTVSLKTLANGGHGGGAIVRGHLHVNQLVDIGTTADTDSLVTGTTITAVDDTETAPTITIGSSISTTSGTHFVYAANPNSATAASTELNGLRNSIGTSTYGGINPATAGNEYWKAAYVDTATTSFSLDMALRLQREVFQRSGKYDAKVITSARQMAAFYSILQNQVRFAGDMKLGAGGVGGLVGLDWNGTGVNVYPDVYDQDWFHLTPEDMVMIFGSIKKPTWVTDLQGGGADLQWVADATSFKNAVVWPFQVGMQRRSRAAAATGLVSS